MGYAIVSFVEEIVLAEVELINQVVRGYIQKTPSAGDYEQYDEKKASPWFSNIQKRRKAAAASQIAALVLSRA